ncbi:MAG: DUF2975 domain-containing protein [Candidatus Aminicenantales bacterium]
MSDNSAFEVAPVVKALRIVLITLLVLYGLFFAAGAIGFFRLILPPLAFKPLSGLREETKIFFDNVLTGPFYFFIAYCIFRLIKLISRGEPFSPANPRYIRRIGYAVLGLAGIHVIAAGLFEFTAPEVALGDSLIRILYGGLSTVLLGFGILVIARVLEAGVKLQQDQNLTV